MSPGERPHLRISFLKWALDDPVNAYFANVTIPSSTEKALVSGTAGFPCDKSGPSSFPFGLPESGLLLSLGLVVSIGAIRRIGLGLYP
jgi:hypothetical protein